MSGVSFRPLMPIATKILLSKDILEETDEIFNMFSVT